MKEKILGIDWGERKLGLAIGDIVVGIATPYKVIRYKEIEEALEEIKLICAKEGILEIVIGLPLKEDGKFSSSTKKTLDFIKRLKETLNIKVITWDERLTTAQIYSEARYTTKKGGKKRFPYKWIKIEEDRLSATIMLQSYLDKEYKRG